MSTPSNAPLPVDDPSPEITAKYADILISNGITDPVKQVTVIDANLNGEGFASQSKLVTITFTNENKLPLNLFVKCYMNSESHKEVIKSTKAFEKEARFFMEYVPAARKLCKSLGQEQLLDIYPKCYYGDEDMIVLENLVLEQGFQVSNKEIMHDLDETRCALVTLAKHHAISIAMIKDYGGADKFFDKFPNLDLDSFIQPVFCSKVMEPMFDQSIKANLTLLEKCSVEGRDECVAKLKSLLGKAFGVVMDVLNEPIDEESLLVLNHGDYWGSNMMIAKNKETGEIISHKTIDLQMTRYNSPFLDIGYYLYTSVQAEVRRAHMKDLITFYLETLKSVANSLDCCVDITNENAWKVCKRKFKQGYWHGMGVSSGLGYTVAKTVNFQSLEEFGDWRSVFENVCNIWIDNHPDESVAFAIDVVNYVAEYNELTD